MLFLQASSGCSIVFFSVTKHFTLALLLENGALGLFLVNFRGVDTVMDNTIRKAYSTSQSGSSATER